MNMERRLRTLLVVGTGGTNLDKMADEQRDGSLGIVIKIINIGRKIFG